mmetsp:Transcript_15160/g.26715  ORF Transcript_15160/g.26715 Transcript_15160/m.26715 type:complete len:415 (+) Transcript_15160:227-1471(+)|eukprot:CAMPEP_0203760186 /NCGR_PEP_ID=MMETSP0098-20131031/13539_1 /ASSEMBLY_ACC=CAM_ASM_000208 /TAXON_ID=96639 /ORGANISM=" , Strain NY0313808BC1" /LENGTH=414 /DNA_ID=CAMNT_0050653653 /DNA_START=131 /DNA_END=1375 /DNA_ORIENTATION=+
MKFPWRIWKSPIEQLAVLPTFAFCEWSMRALALATYIHAKRTNQLGLWFSAWVCGTVNDLFFMVLPFCDNFWQAQACVMLTPRLPLYIVEMYACVLYTSASAARKFKLPYLSEAALTGLLAHTLHGVLDVNAPRFLWWTFHDSDPAISKRLANAPLGSSLWILTYCAIHTVLQRWVNDASFDVSPLVKLLSSWKVPKLYLDSLLKFQSIHSTLVEKTPVALKIAFCATVCTPMFMMGMGLYQVFSLDKLGVPGPRSYTLALVSYVAVLLQQCKQQSSLAPSAIHEADGLLFKLISVYYAVQTSIAVFGDPKTHISTGLHQKCSSRRVIVHDIMGLPRNEYIPPSGPCEHSQDDYQMNKKECDDPNGGEMIVPEQDSEWYTIVGKDHKAKNKEIGVVVLMSLLGMSGYGMAFLKR